MLPASIDDNLITLADVVVGPTIEAPAGTFSNIFEITALDALGNALSKQVTLMYWAGLTEFGAADSLFTQSIDSGVGTIINGYTASATGRIGILLTDATGKVRLKLAGTSGGTRYLMVAVPNDVKSAAAVIS
jgi:hypothetical protein